MRTHLFLRISPGRDDYHEIYIDNDAKFLLSRCGETGSKHYHEIQEPYEFTSRAESMFEGWKEMILKMGYKEVKTAEEGADMEEDMPAYLIFHAWHLAGHFRAQPDLCATRYLKIYLPNNAGRPIFCRLQYKKTKKGCGVSVKALGKWE